MGIFSLKNLTLSLLFIIAIALSGWSIMITNKSLPTTTKDLNQPDAYMEDAIATIMNKEGKPTLKIEAPNMVHYPENDITYIEHPHVTVFRQSPEPWYINSDSAKSIHGLDQITFSDNVVIHHSTDIDNPNTTMQTDSLTVLPNQQQAKTDTPILITQPNTIVHAVGMLADLNNGTIKLLSQAKGEFVPHA